MRDTEHAAIAQQVERILGKNEDSSSNLDSSSTEKARNRKVSSLFLFFSEHFESFLRRWDIPVYHSVPLLYTLWLALQDGTDILNT